MNSSKFDPWSMVDCSDARAYRAHRAYSSTRLGTLGTIGTGDCVSLGDFEERSAIIEIDASIDRAVARKQAAQEFGFSSVTDLHATTVRKWREQIQIANVGNGKNSGYLRAAAELCNGPWIGRLAALGWDEVSLFSISFEQGETGGLIQTINMGHIFAATDTAVYISPRVGRMQTYSRFSASTSEPCLVWDVRILHELTN